MRQFFFLNLLCGSMFVANKVLLMIGISYKVISALLLPPVSFYTFPHHESLAFAYPWIKSYLEANTVLGKWNTLSVYSCHQSSAILLR